MVSTIPVVTRARTNPNRPHPCSRETMRFGSASVIIDGSEPE
jgi:hypothetical protein